MGATATALRDDAMVTARVPREIKRRGDAKLKEIGATATQLINASYEYVIANGKLPGANAAGPKMKPGRRVITPEMREKILEFDRRTTVHSGRMPSDVSYEELREAAMAERFADR